MLNVLKGRKTYIVAVVLAALSVCAAFGVDIPAWIWGLLGALGLGTLKAASAKAEAAAVDTKQAVDAALGVEEPVANNGVTK